MDKEIQNYHQSLSQTEQEICNLLYDVINTSLSKSEHKLWLTQAKKIQWDYKTL
ncbi:hypothetical protein LPTSP2_25320 [Leptospira ellinghausenii]|uniref:Uncharacterized protein n=1 Tax=Leptospira ellinghausenii TaxID=1917822 RepID=A0A2P2DF27_9LEPT|nr:hypothetical protein [Leptospira ellinghausenii]GBF43235.1 hypothetical protein LPTSP2_25320 [Leptospira ellinghausenii]